MNVVVLDKTVSTPDRREHRSLMWVLDFWKIRKPDGSRNNAQED